MENFIDANFFFVVETERLRRRHCSKSKADFSLEIWVRGTTAAATTWVKAAASAKDPHSSSVSPRGFSFVVIDAVHAAAAVFI